MSAAALILELATASRKRFGDFAAVDDLSLDIAAGRVPHLARRLGLGQDHDAPHDRRLRAADRRRDPDGRARRSRALPPFKRDINTVFQHYALFPHMSVRDNVGYGLRMRGVPAAEREERVTRGARDGAARAARCRARRGSSRAGSSSGWRSPGRWSTARGSCCSTSRSARSTSSSGKEMQLELKHLQTGLGITFVYVTHDQEEALTMSDRIVLMRQGRIAQIGTPARAVRPARLPLRRRLHRRDQPAAPARVLESGRRRGHAAGGRRACVRGADATRPGAGGAEAWLAVRPEAIGCRTGDGAAGGRTPSLATVVRRGLRRLGSSGCT